MNRILKNFFPAKPAFSLIEVLVSLLIISAVSLSAVYIVNGHLKNAHLRDIHTMELIQNIDTVEKIKADVKTKTQLETFANAHTNVTLNKIFDNLYKVTVGQDRKLTIVLKVGGT